MRVGYDSVNVDAIPKDPNAILLGYVDGKWPTWSVLRRTRPNRIILQIAVDPQHTAQVLDREPEDATAEEAPPWTAKMRELGGIPMVYVSAGGGPNEPGPWHDVRQEFWNQKVREPLYLIADYSRGVMTSIPQEWLNAGCVGVQYQSDSKKDLDYWIFLDYIPGIDGPDMSQGVDDEMIWGKDGATLAEQIVDGRTAKCREWWLMYHQNREPSVQQLESAVQHWSGNGGDLTEAAIKDGTFGQ